MESFLSEGKITSEAFAEQCLPTLLALSQDRVSNVRLTVARVLKDTILSIGMCTGVCVWVDGWVCWVWYIFFLMCDCVHICV